MRKLLAHWLVVFVISGLFSLAYSQDCSDVAYWLFDGDGVDQAGSHNAVLAGAAGFVSTGLASQGGSGLRADDYLSYAEIPSVDEIVAGRISFEFKLEEDFSSMTPGNGPIIFLNSNRSGHLIGDFSIKLEPGDGKLWITQEDPVVNDDWNLRTNKDEWSANVWYTVVVLWGPIDRDIYVTWEAGSDYVVDEFSRPFFSSVGLQRICHRAEDSPPIGLVMDWLKVEYCDPATPSETESWGGVKSMFR